jgi:hypothetical protein
MEPSSLATWVIAAGTSSAEAQQTGRALLLWLILAVGLGVFLIGILLVSWSRRNRAPGKPQPASADLDAWQASADRISPPTPPGEE